MNKPGLKVAVIGASGIGKNHARWFHQHGCDVCAFAGSSPESVQRTQKVLEESFGFSGRGYSDVSTMLREAKPDAVCVSSLPPLHFGHTMQCLAAGTHVLCEKPLVYDASKSMGELMAEARQMVNEATSRGQLLGTQMQYAVAVEKLLELAGVEAHEVREFTMEMESKNLKHGREYEPIWIDLSPHPLSVLQKAMDNMEIDENSIQCQVRAYESEAHFQLHDIDISRAIAAHIIVRYNPDAATPLRCFTINGRRINYAGRKDAQGEFRTYLTTESGQEIELPDFVDTLIGNFVAACQGQEQLLVTGADGAQNVEWQLKILGAGQRV